MIATRLHAKRLSTAVPHRPSVSSTQSSAIPSHVPQQHRQTRNRLDEIQTIDSDHTEEDDDHHINESTQVERIFFFSSYPIQDFQVQLNLTYIYIFYSRYTIKCIKYYPFHSCIHRSFLLTLER